ncbi:MAG: hypothetical protein HOP16_07600 [Acidobacteria bacterium]|nr:hypothetical protein [Acidobacteriota bacterium]
MVDLGTTNILLGIMAVVSLLEALALIVVIGGAVMLYRRLFRLLAGIEERQIAPVAARVNAILDDVKGVSATVKGATDAADSGVRRGLTWVLNTLRRLTDRS